MVYDRKKIGRNIHDLRKAHGETQYELGKVINVNANTVAMYEGGKRLPDIQIIQDIASHYGYSVDQLLEGDFSQFDFQIDSITWDKMISVFEVQFPIICSELAMQDNHFEKAYQQTKEIWESLKKHRDIMSRTIRRALEEYEASLLGNPDIIEAAANMLWLTFINYSLMPDEHSLKMGEAILYGKALSKDFVKKYVLNDSNPISEENAKNKKEYVKDSQEAVLTLIRILKESTQYADLADYYLALRYAIGMVENEHNSEFNKAIGKEMLTIFAILGNKYAVNLFKVADWI